MSDCKRLKLLNTKSKGNISSSTQRSGNRPRPKNIDSKQSPKHKSKKLFSRLKPRPRPLHSKVRNFGFVNFTALLNFILETKLLELQRVLLIEVWDGYLFECLKNKLSFGSFLFKSISAWWRVSIKVIPNHLMAGVLQIITNH